MLLLGARVQMLRGWAHEGMLRFKRGCRDLLAEATRRSYARAAAALVRDERRPQQSAVHDEVAARSHRVSVRRATLTVLVWSADVTRLPMIRSGRNGGAFASEGSPAERHARLLLRRTPPAAVAAAGAARRGAASPRPAFTGGHAPGGAVPALVQRGARPDQEPRRTQNNNGWIVTRTSERHQFGERGRSLMLGRLPVQPKRARRPPRSTSRERPSLMSGRL